MSNGTTADTCCVRLKHHRSPSWLRIAFSVTPCCSAYSCYSLGRQNCPMSYSSAGHFSWTASEKVKEQRSFCWGKCFFPRVFCEGLHLHAVYTNYLRFRVQWCKFFPLRPRVSWNVNQGKWNSLFNEVVRLCSRPSRINNTGRFS